MKFFVSLFFFFIIYLMSSPATGTNPDITHETCLRCAKSSPNIDYGFCISSLGSAPRSHTASLKKLGVISVKVAQANATSTRSYIRRLLKQKPKDHYLKDCLKSCVELYSDAIPNLKSSAKAIRAGHYGDANAWISSVMDAADTCEECFREKKGLNDPIKKKNNDLFELAAISLAITTFL